MNNKKVFLILFCLCLSFFDRGASAGIFDSLTSVKLYKQIQEVNEEYSELKKAEEAYKAAKEKEQSIENKTLTAVTTAAMGIGGMELAMGLSEKAADKEAEQDMKAYLSTFRCSYTDGKSFKGGPDQIELPGGNDAKIMSYRNEYLTLAKDLKERKEALGMKPGIESEEILDKADMGLYDDENVGITSGVYGSLYRATALNSAEDQAKIQEEKDKSAKRVKGGAIAVGAGAAVGIVGNSLINGKLGEIIENKNTKNETEQNTKPKDKKKKNKEKATSDNKNKSKLEEIVFGPLLSESEEEPVITMYEKPECDVIDDCLATNGYTYRALNKTQFRPCNVPDKKGDGNTRVGISTSLKDSSVCFDLEPGEWEIEFSYGYIKGTSMCAITFGQYGKPSDVPVPDDPEEIGGNCWCKATSVPYSNFSTGIWIPANPVYDKTDIDGCNSICAQYCAQQIANHDGHRKSLLGFYE